MFKVKNAFALLVVLCILVSSVFVGCNTSNGDKQNEGDKEAAVPEISFTMSQLGWGGQAIDPNLMGEVYKKIEEKTGCKLKPITPPQSDYNDKLQVMLSSGQATDIFAVRKATDSLQITAQRGHTMALDNLLTKRPEIQEYLTDDIKPYVTVKDEIHGVPMYKPLAKVIWIRKDMMDKYGISISSTPTTEEFYTEMLKVAGNKDGIIPFMFPKFVDNLPYFFNPFGAYFGIGQDENGKYYDGFNTEEAKEALAYIAKLYKDKIWDQEFPTNENTTIREGLFGGNAASNIDYSNRYIYYVPESEKINAATDFIPIYELKGPNGDGGNLNEAIQDVLCVSAKTKNAEKALEVIGWLFYTEEGVMTRNLGIEGKHYNIENGVFTPTEQATNSGYKGDANAFFISIPEIKDYGFKWDETTEKFYGKQKEITAESEKHLGPKFLTPGGKSNLYDQNQPTYKAKIEEIATGIIMGQVTIEEGYKKYEDFWKSINGDEMINELNK